MTWARFLGAVTLALLFSLTPVSADRTPTPTCGDVDNSGSVDISDAIYLLNYIFGMHPPLPEPGIGDVNCDGKINISDVTYLVAYIFYAGAVPCAECPLGPSTEITGTLRMQAGVDGDLGGTEVAIYQSLAQWNNYSPFMIGIAAGSGSEVGYYIANVPAGTYYLDAWKDNDHNFVWSSGDFVAWYGSGGIGAPNLSAFSIASGEHKTINLYNLIPIP